MELRKVAGGKFTNVNSSHIDATPHRINEEQEMGTRNTQLYQITDDALQYSNLQDVKRCIRESETHNETDLCLCAVRKVGCVIRSRNVCRRKAYVY
jgi:hypothetical protein